MLNRRISWLAALALLTLLAFPAPSPARTPDAKAHGKKPYVKVMGTAVLKLKPDQASITLGVVTTALKAGAAARQNAEAMTKVMEVMKAALGPKDSLQTVGYSLSAYYEWDKDTRKNLFKGYRASNQVRVVTAQVKRVGGLLDAATGAGANSVSGPSWSVSDSAAAQLKAQAHAVADAKSQAENLARAAGVKLGPVRSIVAGGASSPANRGAPQRMLMAKAAPSAPTPAEPGDIRFEVSVRCVFELLPGK